MAKVNFKGLKCKKVIHKCIHGSWGHFLILKEPKLTVVEYILLAKSKIRKNHSIYRDHLLEWVWECKRNSLGFGVYPKEGRWSLRWLWGLHLSGDWVAYSPSNLWGINQFLEVINTLLIFIFFCSSNHALEGTLGDAKIHGLSVLVGPSHVPFFSRIMFMALRY